MALSNPTLLLALLFAGIPVILHLIMRQKPKRLEFPAVRFVAARRETNRRRLRVRHWILLLLRCLALAAAAAALARPSVASAQASRWLVIGTLAAGAAGLGVLAALSSAGQRGQWLTRGLALAAGVAALASLVLGGAVMAGADGMIGDQEAPVSAVLVIDTSPRMELVQSNQTRLEVAANMALQLIRDLPPDSQVAVLDSRRQGAFFAADRAAARTSVQRLETTGAPQPLPQVLLDAVDLAAAGTLARKEVYVFTDLAEAAWSDSGAGLLAERLEESPEVLLYVLDVGVEQPRNVALGDLRLSAETLPRNGVLQIDSQLSSIGVSGERSVRVEVEQIDPQLPVIEDGETKLPPADTRGRRLLPLAAGQSHGVQFEVRLSQPGLHQGRVAIEGADSLSVDDVRHFAVEVREAWPVLLAHGPGASADFLADALAPADFQDFDCQVVPQVELATADLEQYAAVCLLDPEPPQEALWQKLLAYVEQGGALWVQLGRNARGDASFNGQTAQQLLAGPLLRQWRAAERELFVDLRDASHPALALFRQQSTSVPWNRLPVFRHWVLGALNPDIRVLAGYSANSHAALAERRVGEGIAVTMTTPLSDVTYSNSAWNELAYGENNWPAFLLANELVLYLVRGSDQRLNYFTGETVELANDERSMPRRYQLFSPAEPPQDVTSREGKIRVSYTDSPGAYRLKGSRGALVSRGFACNLPAETSRLERLAEERLQELLGQGRYQLARDYQQLQRVQGRQRVGREFFALLLLVVAAVLGVEHLLANRFYKSDMSSVRRAAAAAEARQAAAG